MKNSWRLKASGPKQYQHWLPGKAIDPVPNKIQTPPMDGKRTATLGTNSTTHETVACNCTCSRTSVCDKSGYKAQSDNEDNDDDDNNNNGAASDKLSG
ncbi:unnamed protein product [marine sediment metagenome]|uniref:Uncharacterized protein n=1 Tax=marine sediment metagenome TaxID=412755 RepID=X1C8Q9_9ZZZZ